MGLVVRERRPHLAPSAKASQAVRKRVALAGLHAYQPFVVASVGARPGSSKGYPPEYWAEVLDELHGSLDMPVFVLGGPRESAQVRLVCVRARRARATPVVDPLADLPELAAWCARANLVLSADGGARHVAAAVGARQVVVFGPSDPRHTADHLRRATLVRVEVPCGPCHREVCPIQGDAHHVCMRGLAPEHVASAALELLERAG